MVGTDARDGRTVETPRLTLRLPRGEDARPILGTTHLRYGIRRP